jgi:hypothetical protein
MDEYMDVLSILNQANVEIINVSKIEKKLKNIKSIKEKIEHFVLEIMLTKLEEGIECIVSDNKEIEQILKETILEKNRKTKEKYPMYDNSKEKISYVSGLNHAMKLINIFMNHKIDKECEDYEIQNGLNAMFYFQMDLDPNEYLKKELFKLFQNEKIGHTHIITNEDTSIEFEELFE